MDRRCAINILWLSVLSLVESLQVLIVASTIASFVPLKAPPLVQKLFPINLYDVHMKRDLLLYHVWVAAALGVQAVLLYVNRQRIQESEFWRKIVSYTAVMAALVYLQVFAVFKILLWQAGWAKVLFYIFLASAILARIFWPEVSKAMAWLWTRKMVFPARTGIQFLGDVAAIAILLVLIFLPNLHEVLARMFSYDKFYHLDSFIMSPAWAHHKGLILNKDITSEYSLIIPLAFDTMMKGLGGFSYAHAVGLMIGLSAVYYFLLYGLWRYWTGSFLLAFAAILLTVKLQFFHWGVIPLIWIYPSATPLRFLPDVIFFFFVLRFTQTQDLRWLWGGAVMTGLGLVWAMDVGMYMYATLFFTALAAVYQKGFKKGDSIYCPLFALWITLIPWIVAGVVWSLMYGQLVLHKAFWQNSFEFAGLFLQGWGALPITSGLADQQFFAFCMAFFIPAVYVGTLLYSLSVFIFRRLPEYLFLSIVSVYGLGLYHYFIHRSGVTSFDAVIVPFIFVLLGWGKIILPALEAPWQKAVKIFLTVWALIALMTTYLFTYYPNALNLAQVPWAAEEDFYRRDFDFSQDAALIDRLTAPNEAVPLISSFETRILMQADRKPFFYYFPMVESEHMQGAKLRDLYLHTYARLTRTIKQLEDEKPAHVFIQTRLIDGPQAQDYANSHEAFKELMAYINAHYHYEAQGQYLTALKIK